MKDTIVVFGYPKSGNTWLARLVGELAACPVRGYYKADETHRDVATEGQERVSPLTVWKGHQPHDKAAPDFDLITPIYVVRDVRDVAISGAHYYKFPPSALEAALRRLPLAWKLADRLAASEPRRIDRMIDILDRGTERIAHVGVPWDRHARGYLDAGVFHVRYEDLLAEPMRECRRICAHLGLERSDEQLREAIGAQSFEAVKRKFADQGDRKREKFMRAGRSAQWLDVLSPAQASRLETRFAATLQRLGYPVGHPGPASAVPRAA